MLCEAKDYRYSNVIALWTSILCPLPLLSAWHKLECLMETCPLCGIHKLRVFSSELSTETLIKWRRVAYIEVEKTRADLVKKVPQLQYMETPPRALIDYLKLKLVEYIVLNFISKWQEKEFKSTLSKLMPNTILSCIDFNQNYSLKVQDKV